MAGEGHAVHSVHCFWLQLLADQEPGILKRKCSVRCQLWFFRRFRAGSDQIKDDTCQLSNCLSRDSAGRRRVRRSYSTYTSDDT